MNLAFRLFLLVFVFACLLPGAFSALSTVTKAVCNSGDANVVWSTGNTYFLNVDGNVDVENCQLTIQPGAIVKLKSNDINSTFLRVWNRGVLLAQGNDTNKVIFTSQNDDSVGTAATDSNGTPGSPDYNSAIFLSASAGTTPDANDFFDLNQLHFGMKKVVLQHD